MESAISSGMGHLLSFSGTDTIPAILVAEKYYTSNVPVGGSVPATEHSVMCAGGEESEFETFERLITEVYPSGVVSIVSDTWDLWKVLTDYMPRLKNTIMARDGKVVIRPDSGDPVNIICGTSDKLGVIEHLWNVFGGSITPQGYKLLDPHIGAIYGDSITLDRAKRICDRLVEKGFAPSLVFGVGSYTYQYNTRDTFGLAMKATYAKINGQDCSIFKSPVTDDGMKRSARGLLSVGKHASGDYYLEEDVTPTTECCGELSTVFLDGIIHGQQTFNQIRNRLHETF